MSDKQNEFKYLLHLTMVFMTILFVNDAVVYKLINIYGISISAASLVFPITYTISDIITAVYGYAESKKVMYMSIIYNIIFTSLIYFLIKIPSPFHSQNQYAYDFVFSRLPIVSLTYLLATPLGHSINILLMNKLQFISKGKYFIIGSIASSAIGEFVFSAIAVSCIWYFYPMNIALLPLIISTYAIKPLLNVLISPFANIIVLFLKNKEGIDMYKKN